ncbi:MAG: hypothetical protein GY759_07220 [Chloroflexi bacterium]|nr:hypothetical protein [Chloroflexota bacterium]
MTKRKFTTKLEFISVDDLMIDDVYQRTVDLRQVKKIKENPLEDAFGTLHVGRRDDGRRFVVDGQHRLLGFREHYSFLPCTVFKSSGRSHEASVFKAINSARRQLRPVEVHICAVAAGDQESIELDDFCQSRGFIIGVGGWANIAAVRQLRDSYERKTLDWVLEVLCGFNSLHKWQKAEALKGGTIESLSDFILHYGHKLNGHQTSGRMASVLAKWSKDDWAANKGRARDGKKLREDRLFKWVAAWNRSRVAGKITIDAVADYARCQDA